MSYLDIKSLAVDYVEDKDRTPALKSVNLKMEKEETGVIIGPSGCGKSTLLNVLAGLNRNYQGEVLIDGEPPRLSSESALILQEYGLLPWKTVWKNITLGLELEKIPGKAIISKTEMIMERLNILSLAKRYPAQLSGGQRQRVAIARSLVLDPKLLLMDEPFSSLDALTREEMQNFLLEIWQQSRLNMLLVTHNIEEAVFLGQKIFVMSNCPGTIIEEIENKLAGDFNLRGKVEFLETCNYIRSILGREDNF